MVGARVRFARVLLLALSFICLLSSRSEAAKPEVMTLASGAKLIVSYEPDSPLVAIDCFFRVGYAEERQARLPEGTTSLLARAWISSVQGMSLRQLGEMIGGVGGNVGAQFGGDYTEIWAVTTATDDTVGLAAQTLIMNIIGRPEFTAESVRAAQKEQIRALALENDSLFSTTMNRLRSRLWDASPYAVGPLGTEEAIALVTPEQLRSYYNRYFTPDRAVIVVAGNITAPVARRMIETHISASGWMNRGKSPAIAPIAPETLPRPVPTINVNRRARITFMMAGWTAPGTRDGKDYPALLLLDTMIGSGKGSRLFRNLRDSRGIGYEVGSLLQPGMYQSLLAGYVATATYRMTSIGPQPMLDEVSKALLAEMKSVLTDPPDAAELNRARALVTGRYALRHQRLKDRAFLLGWSEVMGLGVGFDADYDARMAAVTIPDIQRVARDILDAHHVLAVTLPE